MAPVKNESVVAEQQPIARRPIGLLSISLSRLLTSNIPSQVSILSKSRYHADSLATDQIGQDCYRCIPDSHSVSPTSSNARKHSLEYFSTMMVATYSTDSAFSIQFELSYFDEVACNGPINLDHVRSFHAFTRSEDALRRMKV